MKGLWRCGVSLRESSVKGTWREGFLAGDPEGYVGNSLETGISFRRGPILGNLEEGSSSGDFGRRMKRALGMGLLSLSLSDEAPWRGPLGREGLLHWEPRKICFQIIYE